MVEDNKEQREKVDAIVTIGSRPNNFRWNINGIVFAKSQLLEEIGNGSKLGKQIIKLAQEISPRSLGADSYQLGKRIACLLCGTEFLIVRTGRSIPSCCGQNAEIKTPSRLPSSD